MTKEQKEKIRLETVSRINAINALITNKFGGEYKEGDIKLLNARDNENINKLTKKQKEWLSDLILDIRFSMIGR